jgi:tetratricopeptide (TPR) repeat protein
LREAKQGATYAPAVINLLIALAAGLAGFLLFFLTGIAHAWGSILPGLVALIGVFYLLARRTGKQLEAVMAVAQKEMMARKPERAVAALEEAFKLSRWQLGVAASLHANVGVLLYVQQKFEEAEPHLRKAGATLIKMWQAQAMLACMLYRKKQYDEMEKVFTGAIKAGKNDTLSYAVYAWCERERGEKKKALEILQKGLTENASDEKLKTLVGRAQNDKRYKLDAWGDQWWQFWLEKPPMLAGQQSGNVFSGRQRFGRGGGFRR